MVNIFIIFCSCIFLTSVIIELQPSEKLMAIFLPSKSILKSASVFFCSLDLFLIFASFIYQIVLNYVVLVLSLFPSF